MSRGPSTSEELPRKNLWLAPRDPSFLQSLCRKELVAHLNNFFKSFKMSDLYGMKFVSK